MKFVHEKASIDGDVELAEGVSVWAGASIRGDEGKIVIGKNTSVQDNVVIHGKVSIGENVTIGHGAIVHGAIVGNNVIIGMNSTILNNAKIGDWVIIAAGSMVTEGMEIESGSMVMGIPAKVTRQLAEKDKDRIIEATESYQKKLKDLILASKK